MTVEANAVVESSVNVTEVLSDEAILDSAATNTFYKKKHVLTNYREQPGEVTVANGDREASAGIGDLFLNGFNEDGALKRFVIRDAVCVPGLENILISVSKITANGASVTFGPKGGVLSVRDMNFPFRKDGKLYVMATQVVTQGGRVVDQADDQANAVVSNEQWHFRLGRRNYAHLKKLGEFDVGVPKGIVAPHKCGSCEVGKRTHTTFPRKTNHRIKDPLDMVHVDLYGSVTPASLNGHKYAIMFTCGKTRWRAINFLQRKSEALAATKRYVKGTSGLLHGKGITILQTDEGGECRKPVWKSYRLLSMGL